MGSHSCMGLQSLTLVHFMGRRLLLLQGGRTRKEVSTRLEVTRFLRSRDSRFLNLRNRATSNAYVVVRFGSERPAPLNLTIILPANVSRLVFLSSRLMKWTNVKDCNPMQECDPMEGSYPNYNMMEQALNPVPTLVSILNPRARRSLDGT